MRLLTSLTGRARLHQPQDDDALPVVNDGVHDQTRPVAVDRGPLVSPLVMPTRRLARVRQQLLDADVNQLTELGREAVVLLARDLQPHQARP